jgi:serine/threonine-protein kinase
VEELFHAARLRAPADRSAFLDKACENDAELRSEVESLLAEEDGSRAEMIERPALPGDSTPGDSTPGYSTPGYSTKPGAGTQLGPYRMEVSIGRGGMGEVWKARDTRLNRAVAIKFSTQQFSDRFEREAHAIAALNHTNICTLYDVGPNYLVMELVEGPTLAERIGKGPIPIDEALAIAKQIAEALEAAHEKGIVHRDLKPANIKIRPDGSVKVLDFGLAKAAGEVIAANSETESMTSPGTIMGTPGYMPPEQVRGEKVDKRADIWAFGVVLYEMVAGQKAFEGKTSSDTFAAVIASEPDWEAAPARVRRLLRACLEKDARLRLRDIGDYGRLLEELPAPAAATRGKMGWIAAGALAIAVALLAVRVWTGPQPGDRPITRFSMELTPAAALVGANGHPFLTEIAFSPDGRTIVFASRTSLLQLYKRRLDSREAVALSGTEGAQMPFFSPDGGWIGFQTNNSTKYMLEKVPLNGGPPVTICEVQGPITGASWGVDGTIVFVSNSSGGLMRVSAAGGAPQILIPPDPAKGEIYSSPQWMPDGKTILYTVPPPSDDWNDARIVARRIDTGEQHDVFKGGADARYVPTGHLLYMRNAVLMAVPFDDRRLQLTGQPVALQDGVMQSLNASNSLSETGMGQFAVSATGNLVYASGGIFAPFDSTLVRVDRKGASIELGAQQASYWGLRISPDGERLAFMKPPENNRRSDVWVRDLRLGTETRLSSQGNNNWPVWSRDGKRLFFAGGLRRSMTIEAVTADGSGVAEPVFSRGEAGGNEFPASLSPDGMQLAYLVSWSDGTPQIWIRPMSGEGKPKLLHESRSALMAPEFSPDGRWIAYSSNESGIMQIYVQALSGPGERHLVSTGAGWSPVWARNGRELFYTLPLNQGKFRLMDVDVAPGEAFKAGNPRVLFEGTWNNSTPVRSYDITPDGQYFIMARPERLPDQSVTKLNVVLNWFEELKKLAPRSSQ